jgi:hypothetical protein
MNKFLYDDIVCKREYKKDVEKRRKEVLPNIKTILYPELANIVVAYVGFD